MAADADTAKVAQLRELLPATGAGIYLDTASRGPLPAETAAAMREAEDWELAVGRVWEGRDEDVAQRREEAVAVIAALIGAEPSHVVLTNGLKDAQDLAWDTIGDRARIVDLSNRVGVTRVAVDGEKAHALLFTCHRWLLGPEETGVLWLADDSSPPWRNMPRTTLIGLARSVGWLEMYVGLEWIYERTAALAARLFDALVAASGVEMLTPREILSAIVSFRLANWPAEQAADELSRRVHALVLPMPNVNAIRASVGWFNTEDELDRFAAAVAELARHTPATLPRRPSLIVLSDS
jgi:selenocysteine lyase/cysteine desulfurase